MTWMRREGIKRGESKLASNHFHMCSLQSGPLRDVHRVIQRREEKREEGDRGGQEDKRIKRRKTDPASNQFPKCSPPSGTHRDSQSCIEKRRGREETEATWWRKRRVQRGREQSSQ